jgi:hypothetical protein
MRTTEQVGVGSATVVPHALHSPCGAHRCWSPRAQQQKIHQLAARLGVPTVAMRCFSRLAAIVILVMGIGSAQNNVVGSANGSREDWLTKPVPHPFVDVGPSLMGGGYATFAYHVGGGIDIESTHVIVRAMVAYDNGRKVNDNDQPNPNGHDRYLDGALYYRLPDNIYFGGGYTWSQLSTTNYTKGGGRYEIGGGYDLFLRSCAECRRDFSMRINVDWITAGTDWQNGSHGPNTTVTFPAPCERRHWFWRQSVVVYRFHETVTEPTNIPLTQLQRSTRSITNSVEFGLIYRF